MRCRAQLAISMVSTQRNNLWTEGTHTPFFSYFYSIFLFWFARLLLPVYTISSQSAFLPTASLTLADVEDYSANAKGCGNFTLTYSRINTLGVLLRLCAYMCFWQSVRVCVVVIKYDFYYTHFYFHFAFVSVFFFLLLLLDF